MDFKKVFTNLEINKVRRIPHCILHLSHPSFQILQPDHLDLQQPGNHHSSQIPLLISYQLEERPKLMMSTTEKCIKCM